MKQKPIRLLIALIVTVLFVTSFSGCEKTEKKEEIAMGRYVEEVVELPEKYKDYDIVGLTKDAEDKLEVFLMKSFKPFVKLIKEDDWMEEKQDWLAQIFSTEYIIQTSQINGITLSEDGIYYALILGNNGYSVYQSQEDGKKAHKIPITFLEENTERYSKYWIESIDVLKNGTILLCDRNTRNTMLFSNKTGELMKEIDIDAPITTNGDSYGGIKSGGKTLVYYEDEEVREVAVSGNNTSGKIAITQEATYLLNYDGIHRLDNEGTIWQTVVDGGLTSMSKPNNVFSGLVAVDNNEYYTLITDYYQSTLYHYYYDETLPSLPNNQITVYSLYENEWIRKTINAFKFINSDVKVDYVVAMNSDNSINYGDAVRLLNTELLAGAGADIIVLDGLPLEAFNEKGILADLTDIVSPMIKDGTLIDNITNCFTDKKKIYGVPVFYQPLIYYSSEEVLDALDNLDSLAAYIKEHPEEKIFPTIPFKKLADQFFYFNYDTLINKDGQIEKASLLQFLENLNIVSQNIGAVEKDEIFIEMKGSLNLRNWGVAADMDITYGNAKAALMQTECIQNIAFPMQTIKENNLSYRDVHSYFIPTTIIGLNQASDNKEIAKQFIKSLLSEEGHDAILYTSEGLPVNDKALMGLVDSLGPGSIGFLLEDGTNRRATFPTKEKMKEMITYTKKLTRPIIYSSIKDEVCERIVVYLRGDSTAEETAQDIINLINLSMSE